MKIRKGFVTNSSSSSFIIAKHREFTPAEAREIIIKNSRALKCTMEEFGYTDEGLLVDDLLNELYELKHCDMKMVLGDWMVTSCYFGDTSEMSLLYFFLYEIESNIDNEHIKIQTENV